MCNATAPPGVAFLSIFLFRGLWTHRIVISDRLDLLVVVGSGQLCQAFWVKLAAVREELGSVFFGQLCAEGVDGDDESPPVSLKLQQKQ